MDRTIKDIKALGQANDGIYQINDDKYIYEINDNSKINIKAGIKAYIIDNTNNKEIYVNCGKDSSVEYTILNSNSSKRTFDVYGELIINEILLEKSNESFTIS